MNEFLSRINWGLLRQQKSILLNLPENEDDIEGIVNLLDALQDCAVDSGYSASEVFGDQDET